MAANENPAGEKSSSPPAALLISHLKVVNCGLPRTGTTSTGLALAKLLDGPVLDGIQDTFLYGSRARQEELMKLYSLAPGSPALLAQLHKILTSHKPYVATTDAPFPQFLAELLQLAPDLKIVCTTRDFDPWYASLTKLQRAFAAIAPYAAVWPSLKRCLYAINELGPRRWRATYGTDVIPPDFKMLDPQALDKDLARKMFDGHREYIRRVVPADRLLIFEVRDGWKPLCEFLGKPVPTRTVEGTEVEMEFPHEFSGTNIGKLQGDMMKTLQWKWAMLVLGAGLVAVGSVAGARWFYQYMK